MSDNDQSSAGSENSEPQYTWASAGLWNKSIGEIARIMDVSNDEVRNQQKAHDPNYKGRKKGGGCGGGGLGDGEI